MLERGILGLEERYLFKKIYKLIVYLLLLCKYEGIFKTVHICVNASIENLVKTSFKCDMQSIKITFFKT